MRTVHTRTHIHTHTHTHTHYSAILYLNDEFEGGEFFFAHSTTDLSPQVYIVLIIS